MVPIQELLTNADSYTPAKSVLLYYPDNRHRIVTLQEWYWDVLSELEDAGYEFWDLMKSAIDLAVEYPSEHGYEFDIQDNTASLIEEAYRNMVNERAGPILSPG